VSNLALFNPGGSGQVSRAIARETRNSLAIVAARAEVAHAQLTEAGSLMNRGATDVINTVALCADGVRQVPESAQYLVPLLRNYSNLVGEIIQRGVR
jgi:hypothetical protein